VVLIFSWVSLELAFLDLGVDSAVLLVMCRKAKTYASAHIVDVAQGNWAVSSTSSPIPIVYRALSLLRALAALRIVALTQPQHGVAEQHDLNFLPSAWSVFYRGTFHLFSSMLPCVVPGYSPEFASARPASRLTPAVHSRG